MASSFGVLLSRPRVQTQSLFLVLLTVASTSLDEWTWVAWVRPPATLFDPGHVAFECVIPSVLVQGGSSYGVFEHDREDGHGPQPHLFDLFVYLGRVDLVPPALRIVDGVVVVVDCIDCCAVQTVTVSRQTLAVRVISNLCVIKVDRCLLGSQMEQ